MSNQDSSSFNDELITPVGLVEEPERDTEVHAHAHGPKVMQTDNGNFGGDIIKKPYKRNMKIGWPRRRYIVLCEQSKVSWYQDYQSYIDGKRPHGSLMLTPQTEIRVPITPDKKYFTIRNPADPAYPLELYSIDKTKPDEDWVETLRGRINMLRFGTKSITELRKGEITIFSAGSEEGKKTLEAFLKSNLWEKSSRLNCIVEDEYAFEEINAILQNYPRLKDRVSVNLIQYNNLKALRDAVENTKIAIIAVPFANAETRTKTVSNHIDSIKGKKCFTILISSRLAEIQNSYRGESYRLLEQKIKNSKMFYCIFRIAHSMELLSACAMDTKNESEVKLPVDEGKSFSLIALQDLGDAIVNLTTDLANPLHENTTYILQGSPISAREFVATLNLQSKDREVEYTRCSMDNYLKAQINRGFLAWAMKEQEEFFSHVQNNNFLVLNDDTSDLQRFIKREPKSLKMWVEEHKDDFL